MRKEKDFIGEINISKDALYGIHSFRANANFKNSLLFHIEWYKSMALVKHACYQCCIKLNDAIDAKYKKTKPAIKIPDPNVLNSIISATTEMQQGQYFEHFIVPGISGGAGTSINMNVNEIITNVALVKLGYKPGEYQYIDPIEDANIFQSTNDVVPTALKVAVLYLLHDLEKSINTLRIDIEKRESESRNLLRIAYTQMQEAVPSSIGRLFATYNNALSRDWWRVSKCAERLKTVNLGGGAIGSGLSVPRFFIMEVVQNLNQLTGLPLTRADDMMDATSNLDSFVEVHAILKAHAVNLEKMMGDIRLLASDFHQTKELTISACQVGSSIMPGKVNPVISEYVISIAHKVYANDQLISSLCGQSCLDLNAYLPTIGHAMIESLKLLIAANDSISENVINGMSFNSEASYRQLLLSPAITTALIPVIGYNKATELSKYMKLYKIDIIQANDELKLIVKAKLEELMKPENLLKEGFSLNEIEI